MTSLVCSHAIVGGRGDYLCNLHASTTYLLLRYMVVLVGHGNMQSYI